MSETTPARARSLRIRAEEVRARLEAGQPVLFLDARSELAWNASSLKARGAVRLRPARLVIDPGWDRGHLTVIYCA
jgi:hypothetical protein